MNSHERFSFAGGQARRVSDAHRMIGELLLKLGVTPHLVGFDSLCGGIRMTAEQDRASVLHPGEICTAVEALSGAANGEHAIRDAINAGFLERSDLHAKIFPFSDRPSNSEFVCTIAELVRSRMAPM